MTIRDTRIDALMRLYERGELSRAEMEEQVLIADEMADDARRRRENIA